MVSILVLASLLRVQPQRARLYLSFFDDCLFSEPVPKKANDALKARSYQGFDEIAPLIIPCFHRSKSSLGPVTSKALEVDALGHQLLADLTGRAALDGKKGFFDVSNFDRLILSNPKMRFLGMQYGLVGSLRNNSRSLVALYDANGFEVISCQPGQSISFDLWPSSIKLKAFKVGVLKFDPCSTDVATRKLGRLKVSTKATSYSMDAHSPPFRFLGRAPIDKRSIIEGTLDISVDTLARFRSN